jgi:pyruvate/2-oxoglutarate dehydrogenase complex dihydrolipoamide acyltransferase (E2) component
VSNRLLVPQLNPNDPEVELSQWHKKNGERVKKGDLLCDFTSSKAVYQHESSAEGFLAQAAPRGSRLKAGALLGILCATEKEALATNASQESAGSGGIARPVFSLAALAGLKELGLKESDFSGHEFVTEKMVTARAGKANLSATSLAKEKEIEALTQANTKAIRSSLSVQLEAKGMLAKLDKIEITREAHVARCVARALKTHPRFLLRFGEVNPEPAVDIGFALDLGAGVRLLKASNADSWTSEKWMEQITDWSLRLMRNEIRLEELDSGRFTITDLSSLGILFFEPLLVGSQSAILGVGGDLEAATPLLTFTLAFDHRVHDGRQAAMFLTDLKKVLIS